MSDCICSLILTRIPHRRSWARRSRFSLPRGSLPSDSHHQRTKSTPRYSVMKSRTAAWRDGRLPCFELHCCFRTRSAPAVHKFAPLINCEMKLKLCEIYLLSRVTRLVLQNTIYTAISWDGRGKTLDLLFRWLLLNKGTEFGLIRNRSDSVTKPGFGKPGRGKLVRPII